MKADFLKKRKRGLTLILSCMLLACSLLSCKGIEITGKTEDVGKYTRAEAMVVLGSERNRYRDIFGTELWEMPVTGQQETSYGPYFIARTKEFLQDIKTLNLLAQEKGIIATSKEMELIRSTAKLFYEGLSDADKAFFGDCTIKDVTNIYTEYFIASKTADYLLSTVDAEVSDADAKIIHVQQIVVSDETTAQELHEKVLGEGANFAYYARQYSEDSDFEKTLARAEQDNALYSTAFSLEEGEISTVFRMDGRFYILKCTNAYDREATKERKERLELAIRSNALTESYADYAAQHIIRFRADFWKEIDLTAYPDSAAANFFSLYAESGL